MSTPHRLIQNRTVYQTRGVKRSLPLTTPSIVATKQSQAIGTNTVPLGGVVQHTHTHHICKSCGTGRIAVKAPAQQANRGLQATLSNEIPLPTPSIQEKSQVLQTVLPNEMSQSSDIVIPVPTLSIKAPVTKSPFLSYSKRFGRGARGRRVPIRRVHPYPTPETEPKKVQGPEVLTAPKVEEKKTLEPTMLSNREKITTPVVDAKSTLRNGQFPPLNVKPPPLGQNPARHRAIKY